MPESAFSLRPGLDVSGNSWLMNNDRRKVHRSVATARGPVTRSGSLSRVPVDDPEHPRFRQASFHPG